MKTNRIIIAIMMLCIFISATAMLSSCDMFATTHEHDLSLVAEVKATCTAEGTEAYYACSGCDKLFTDAEGKTEIAAPAVIEKADHSFANYVSNNDATCTADGTKTAKCDNCSETDTKVDEGSKKAHSFTNYVSNGDATCTADGTKTAKCNNCYKTDTVADVGSKLQHSYIVETVSDDTLKSEADCTNAAVYYKSCSCGAISDTETFEDGTSLGHDYTEKVADQAHLKANAANCQEVDTYWYDCSRCDSISDELYYNSENAGEHNVSTEWTTADGKHFYECTVSGCDYVADEADCSDVLTDNDHKCDVCGAEDITSHVYGDWEKVDENDHKKTCNCGDAVTEAHNWDDGVVTTDPSHTEDGEKTYTCTVCSETKTESVDKITECNYNQEKVDAMYLKSAATCTSPAVYYKSCVCGNFSNEEDAETFNNGDPIAHTYDQEVITLEGALKSAADCEKAAVYYKSCSCGAISDSETFESGAALGHDEQNHDAQEPTCENVGWDAYVTCSRCEYTTYSEKEALGHSETLAHVDTIDATFDSEGSMGYYTCDVCNKNYVDEACTIEINEFTLPKLSLADYTTKTTLEESVVTTVFTLISDTIEYSISVAADTYLLVNTGEGEIYVSEYDYQTLNGETVTVTYEDGKGYTYSVADGATESLVNIKVSGASLTLVGEYNIALAAGWVPTNGDLIIGDGENTATVIVTNKGVYMYGGDLIVNAGSTLTVEGKSINCEDGSCLIIDGTVNAAGVNITGSIVEDENYEYGFIPGLYVRRGTANITGSIKTNSLQVGSEAENASGTLKATHSDNNIIVASGSAKIKYVFAAGVLNIENTASSKTAIYTNTTGGATVDIRSGMTMTFDSGISNMIGTWKAGNTSYYYYVSIEEGATIEGSGNFFRAGKEGELDLSIYCWDTVEINVGGETKVVKVVNTQTITAGKASYTLSNMSFYTPVENAVYTNTGNTVSCGHLGEFTEATYFDGDTTYTIYYQE